MEAYEYLYYEVLKRITRCKNGELFKTCPYLDTPEARAALTYFCNEGYFCYPTVKERLSKLHIPDLKKLLSEVGLPVTGKKDILVERLADTVSLASLNNLISPTEYIALSDKGKDYLGSLIKRIDLEYADLIKSMYTYILNGQINAAYCLMCEYENKQFFKRGLKNDNWENRRNKGMPSPKISFYQDHLENSDNRKIVSLAICYILLGKPSHFEKVICNCDMLGDIPLDKMYLLIEKMDYESDVASALQELQSYNDSDITKYEIVIAYDDRTCPKCQKMDGKVYPVNKAKIGINYPPFHEACRCTTVAVFDDDVTDGLRRRARNPETGKSELIPADMNYKKYMETETSDKNTERPSLSKIFNWIKSSTTERNQNKK